MNSLLVTTLSHYTSKREAFAEARRKAGKLFDKVYGLGTRNKWLARVTGKSNVLQTLATQSRSADRTSRFIVVSLEKIVGTEGRKGDFDNDFNPLKKHNRERWISVAVAHLTGVVLPPVELLRIGDEYYVRDGHHRISVSRALGQAEIDARVVN